MNKFCVMMIAIIVAVSTVSAAQASLLSKRIEAVKKIVTLVNKTVMKTSDDAAKVVWNNKGAVAVGAVATVALTNPEAATAAVTGTADVVYGAVTGGKKTADSATPRANVRQSTGRSIVPTLLFYLLCVGIGIFVISYFRRRIGVFRAAVPLLVVGLLLCCGVTAEASMLGAIPEIQCAAAPVLTHPFVNFVILVITVISFFM